MQTRRSLFWIFAASLMFYVYTKKNIVVDTPVGRQEIINQTKTLEEAPSLSVNQEKIIQNVKLEEADSDSFPAITPFKCVSTAKLYRGR